MVWYIYIHIGRTTIMYLVVDFKVIYLVIFRVSVCQLLLYLYLCMECMECMHACLHVCMSACMHVCMYVCMNEWMYELRYLAYVSIVCNELYRMYCFMYRMCQVSSVECVSHACIASMIVSLDISLVCMHWISA